MKKVVSMLYLDVSQAFPNVAHECLLKMMENMGLGEMVVNWMESFLSGRSTTLAFDDYAFDPFSVPTGSHKAFHSVSSSTSSTAQAS